MQHRYGQVRRRAEAEHAYSFARFHSSDAQAAESDDPGTQQWRGVQVVQGVRKGIDEVGASQRVFGIPSVNRVAGEHRRVAEILHASNAIRARSVDASQPGNAYASARRELADDLMARNQWTAQGRKFALRDVQIRPADPARTDAQQHITGLDGRFGDFFYNQWISRLFENGCSHKAKKGG